MKKLILLFLLFPLIASAQVTPPFAFWKTGGAVEGDTAVTNLGDSLFLYVAGYSLDGAANKSAVPLLRNLAPKTGASHNMVQAVADTMPVFTDSTFQFINFSGDYLWTDLVNKYSQPLTFVLVYRPLLITGTLRGIMGSDLADRYQIDINNGDFRLYNGNTFTVPWKPSVDSLYYVYMQSNQFKAIVETNNTAHWGAPTGAEPIKRINLGVITPGIGLGNRFQLMEFAALSRPLSPHERYKLMNDRATKYGIPVAPDFEGVNCIFDGNSLTQGVFTDADSTYPAQVMDSLTSGGAFRFRNLGVAGQPTTSMIPDTTIEIDASVYVTARSNYLFCWTGIIELDAADDSTTVYNRIKQYCLGRRALYDSVFVLTTLPFHQNAGRLAQMEGLNRMLRAGYSEFSDVLVDIQADPRIGDIGDNLDLTYYYPDEVHLNGVGYNIISSYVRYTIEGGVPPNTSSP